MDAREMDAREVVERMRDRSCRLQRLWAQIVRDSFSPDNSPGWAQRRREYNALRAVQDADKERLRGLVVD
jgi:hypothetical protein